MYYLGKWTLRATSIPHQAFSWFGAKGVLMLYRLQTINSLLRSFMMILGLGFRVTWILGSERTYLLSLVGTVAKSSSHAATTRETWTPKLEHNGVETFKRFYSNPKP